MKVDQSEHLAWNVSRQKTKVLFLLTISRCSLSCFIAPVVSMFGAPIDICCCITAVSSNVLSPRSTCSKPSKEERKKRERKQRKIRCLQNWSKELEKDEKEKSMCSESERLTSHPKEIQEIPTEWGYVRHVKRWEVNTSLEHELEFLRQGERHFGDNEPTEEEVHPGSCHNLSGRGEKRKKTKNKMLIKK